MANRHRVIRRVNPATKPRLDEQFWPVVLAVFILCGLLMGIAAAYLPFGARWWWRDARLWLVAIPLATVLAVGLLRVVDGRLVRRSLQTSIALCLVVHLVLFVASLETDVFGRFSNESADRPQAPRRPRLVVADYQEFQLEAEDRSRQDFMRPLETALPEPRPETSEAREVPPVRPTTDPASVAAPEQRVTPGQSTPERPQPAETTPRHSLETSQLSRRDADRPVPSPVAVDIPAGPTATVSEARLPDRVAVEKQATSAGEPGGGAAEGPAAAPQAAPRAAALSRRELPPRPEVADPSVVLPSQRQLPPVSVPREVLAAPQVSRAADPASSPAELEPRAISVARRDLAAAEVTPVAPQPSSPVASVDVPRHRSPGRTGVGAPADAPSPEAASSPLASRTTVPVPRSGTQAAIPESPDSGPAPGASSEGQVEVARQAAVSGSVPEVPAVPSTPEVGATRPRDVARALSPLKVTLPDREAASRMARAARRAELPTARDAAGIPAAVPTEAGDSRTLAEPSRLAMTRSLSGVAGVGQTANLDRAPAIPTSPSLMASGAARRAAASQELPAGPALSPQDAAVMRRMVAGQQLPGSPVRATTDGVAATFGDPRPAELDASASASLTRSAAQAAPGRVTAAAGTIEVDVGPTRVTDAGGFERAAGGGQPEVNLRSDAPQLSRSQPEGSAMMNLTVSPVEGAVALPVPGEVGAGLAPAASEITPQRSEAASVDAPAAESVAAQSDALDGRSIAPVTARASSLADRMVLSPSEAEASEGEGQRPRDFAAPGGTVRLAIDAPVPAPTLDEEGRGGSSSAGELDRSAAPGTGAAVTAPAAASRQAPLRGAPLADDVAVPRAEGTGPPRGLAASPAERADRSDEPAPRQADLSGAGPLPAAPLARAAPTLVLSPTESIPRVELEGERGAVVAAASPGDLDFSAATPLERRGSGGAVVELTVTAGPGGLGPRVSIETGINRRPAHRDSIQLESTTARFLRRDAGGQPALGTTAVATEAFRRRGARTAGELPERGQGTSGPQTEKAIELGLSYLARRQLADGSWTLQSPGESVALSSDTAATGLALLAFQGAGYHHRDHQYAPQVAAGLAYLIRNQKADGDLFVPLDEVSSRSVWLYSHGIAAIALCEAYGMTQDPSLAGPAQRAIDFIVAAQDKKSGGWRYFPGLESDTSVTGWMLMALKSGELAGLKVPSSTYGGIRKWLDAAQASSADRHLFRYNPYAPDTDAQRHGRQVSTTMTSVGLLMRLYEGWRRDHPAMIQGAVYLGQHLPDHGSRQDPKRDTYYWYYATQVMFHMGGEHWDTWNRRLRSLLLASQVMQGDQAGSWSPESPVPDRWSTYAGRLYVTTMNLLSLEVYYRHLPLYVETGK